MYTVEFASSLVRDLKIYRRRADSLERFNTIIDLLRRDQQLPQSCKDHQLQGKLKHLRELHVEHDWLLVYEKDNKRLRILCLWLVSHKKLRERERAA